MPAISTRRVDKSMKNRTTKRVRPGHLLLTLIDPRSKEATRHSPTGERRNWRRPASAPRSVDALPPLESQSH